MWQALGFAWADSVWPLTCLSMRVFVTGGAGYIGSICVEQLLNAGHEVVVFDNLTEGHRSAVDKRARFINGCLSDRETIINAVSSNQSEIIMHFAANALVGESMTNPSKYFRNNVAYGINLLDAAIEGGVKKIVFSSTCATYGLPETIPMTEELPLNPISPYGESKAIFEKLLSWYKELHGLDFVALRYFNAAGASEHFGEHHRIETHLIPNVLKVALGQSGECKIFGTDYPTPDGTCIRDYIHIIDLAQAHMLAMEPEKNGIFNLGNGEGYSVREVIETCEKVSGSKIKIIEESRRPGDPPRLIASAQKASNELNWKPKYGALEQIIESAWLWHQKNPFGYKD